MTEEADYPENDFPEYTITELQEKMAAGELSAVMLVEQYLQRIEALDSQGPKLNSIIERNPDALAIAENLDRERAAGQVRGALHGIPILLKDNINTADRMMTTSGSLALAGNIAGRDAHLVKALRQAGAVILGKTNLSEWANFRSSRSVSGWSSRGGQTRNPYALDRNPCGSSSGSGVAVAANLCAAAVGTETDGSIVCPSQTNGIVGIKPTLGLISRSGVIPIAHSQDTAGPMARTVTDAAILLGAMATATAGLDYLDPETIAISSASYSDYTQFLLSDGLRGAHIGVARNFFGFHPGVDQQMEAALEVMRQAGATLVDPANLVLPPELDANELEVLYYEFKADLNAYLRDYAQSASVHSMQDIIQFNLDHQQRVMPFFGQERMQAAQNHGPLTEDAYRKALQANQELSRERGIDALLIRHRLDAIVAPTGGPAWLIDPVQGDATNNGGCSTPPAVAGYPHITVPAGLVQGLPVGISFFGTACSEPVLLRLAYAYELASQARRPPRFLPSIDPQRV